MELSERQREQLEFISGIGEAGCHGRGDYCNKDDCLVYDICYGPDDISNMHKNRVKKANELLGEKELTAKEKLREIINMGDVSCCARHPDWKCEECLVRDECMSSSINSLRIEKAKEDLTLIEKEVRSVVKAEIGMRVKGRYPEIVYEADITEIRINEISVDYHGGWTCQMKNGRLMSDMKIGTPLLTMDGEEITLDDCELIVDIKGCGQIGKITLLEGGNKMHKTIRKLYPKDTEAAFIVNKHFGTNFEDVKILGILAVGKEKEILDAANKVEKELEDAKKNN